MVESFRLSQVNQTNFKDFESFTVKWSPDSSLLAVGSSTGFVHLFNESCEYIRNLNCQSGAEKMPITSVRFKPETSDSTKKNIMLVTTCDGGVIHWNSSNGKCMNSTRLREDQVYSSDYSPSGTKYALGCNEGIIKIYDENNYTEITSYTSHVNKDIHHAQRVFCTKWFNENNILTAGWDNKISIWDARTYTLARQILGPHVCGDSVDIRGNYIITGSYNIREQIQVWDLGTGANIHTTTLNDGPDKFMPYCIQFCKTEGLNFAAGGTGNLIHFFNAETMENKGQLMGFEKTVYSLSSSSENKLAVGSGSSLKIYQIS